MNRRVKLAWLVVVDEVEHPFYLKPGMSESDIYENEVEPFLLSLWEMGIGEGEILVLDSSDLERD